MRCISHLPWNVHFWIFHPTFHITSTSPWGGGALLLISKSFQASLVPRTDYVQNYFPVCELFSRKHHHTPCAKRILASSTRGGFVPNVQSLVGYVLSSYHLFPLPPAASTSEKSWPIILYYLFHNPPCYPIPLPPFRFVSCHFMEKSRQWSPHPSLRLALLQYVLFSGQISGAQARF